MPSYNSTFSPADLKWHNTLPEDFTGGSKSTVARTRSPANADHLRKRPSGNFENIDAILQSHVHHTASSPTLLSPLPPTHRLGSSPLPSPIKRPRALQRNTPAKTPTRSKSSNYLAGSGSGMQTPPPSSTATARKRGRPSKKLYPVLPSANNTSTRDSLEQSPPQTSPTKLQKLNGSQSCHNLGLQLDPQSKFSFQQLPDSGILMPSDELPPHFYQKCNDNLWGDSGDFDFIAGLTTANSHGLEHSASFDWSSLRNNASLDNLNHAPPPDIFAPTPELRRQPSQSSLLTDEGKSSADNPTFSFFQFDDPYGLEMPLDVDPNLLCSSTSNSAASSMIGGFREEFKPFPFVQQQQPYQPYQHQHLQQLREQELEMQKQKQLQERLLKERSRRERTIAASGGRHSRHSAALKHSMSDGILTGSGERQVCKAANFNAAVLKRSCSNVGRRGETVLVDRSYTPNPSQRAYNPTHPSGLRRSTLKIQEKPHRTRTEVILAISPGGRAKTETKIIYDNSDVDIEIEEPIMWDSPQESDSSFDDDVPRGLGPDGIDYALFRQRKAADPFQGARQGPLHTLIVPSYDNQNQPPRPQPPRTPTRRSPLKMPLSGSHRKMNGFSSGTTTGTNSLSGRLDSSPRLPTPLRSSPPPAVDRRVRERVRRASHASLTPSLSMSAIGTPRLGSMQEVSDESEAETVVDGTDICILDEEENGDAMHALRKVMIARRNGEASRVTSLQCTPTKTHPASAVKPQAFSTGSSVGTCSSGRHNQMHPQLLRASPVKKKLFEEQILRSVDRQRNGYERQMTDDTLTTPSKRRTRAMERKEMQGTLKGATRCICGDTGDYGGKTLVQCDTCHQSLHMKCIGYNRKSLPDFFECNFCKKEAVEQENIPKYRGRTRSRRAIGGASDDENSIPPR
ncbi:hypothetical protein DFP73DRAFT_594567 [Morchella snyderi]|nr:hypothetical protein DFP73DRAFT_594567 [Morchella snyderi]